VITALIKRIAQHLDENKIPYMIIGGQAVLLYGTPRLTRDIDITLGIDTDQFRVVDNLCRDLDLKVLSDDPERFAMQTKVLPAEDTPSRIRVDFIFSFTPYEKQAIERANKVVMEGYPVSFASREDVVIHKMFAARAVDLEDVRHILAKNRQHIDLAYVRHWLAEFRSLPEHERISEDFERLVKDQSQ
jgi:predicted nucleotidyltransferase